jgi:hypothetical protein
MKLGMGKQFVLVFVCTVALYLGFYRLIEHLRMRKGGWRVVFSEEPAGPVISVSQSALDIDDVRFRFPGAKTAATNLPQTVVFDRPLTNVPFGEVLFIDTTFQPGTIAFRLFGNEIQLLPRALSVNRRETPWRSHFSFDLVPDPKSPASPRTGGGQPLPTVPAK